MNDGTAFFLKKSTIDTYVFIDVAFQLYDLFNYHIILFYMLFVFVDAELSVM